MEQRKDPKPVVRHTPTRPNVRAFESVLKKFTESMVSLYQKRLVDNGGKDLPWQSHQAEDLLELRKMLRDSVREGILERKDQEETIAMLAAMVWFSRQEMTRRYDIMKDWSL
jgi:hypothetical protein